MAKEKNESTRWLQILVGILATIAVSLSSWTVLKAVELDKELSRLTAENAANHLALETKDIGLDASLLEQRLEFKEQRKIVYRMDKTLTRIDDRLKRITP